MGNKINEGTVSVKINDTEIGTANVNNGTASIKYKALDSGNYTININYTCDNEKYAHITWIRQDIDIDEDPDYLLHLFSLEKINTTGIIEYVDAVANITMTPITSSLNDIINISSSITFNNTNINGGRVVFKVNGKTLKDNNGNIEYIPVTNGKATLENFQITADWLKQNSTITTIYSGNGIIQGTTYNNTINITKAKAHIEIEPITTQENSTITITAKITNNKNTQPINIGRIIFKINGRTLRYENGGINYATVENGIATITYKLPTTTKAKEYNLTCIYGHKLYERSEENTTLTITKT